MGYLLFHIYSRRRSRGASVLMFWDVDILKQKLNIKEDFIIMSSYSLEDKIDVIEDRVESQESFRVWRWEVTFPAGEFGTFKEKIGLWLRCYHRDLILLFGKIWAALVVLMLVHSWGYVSAEEAFRERVAEGWYSKNATRWGEFERERESLRAQHPGAWAPRSWADAGAEK